MGINRAILESELYQLENFDLPESNWELENINADEKEYGKSDDLIRRRTDWEMEKSNVLKRINDIKALI